MIGFKALWVQKEEFYQDFQLEGDLYAEEFLITKEEKDDKRDNQN